jgi:malto-oligosyltrehalose synthase
MRITDHWVLDHVMRWLAAAPQSDDQRRAVARFRQLSAPLAAKAVEDTAFYRYGRLLSRNDVGFDVTRFADAPATFHARMRRRQWMSPRGLLATATHDHKRGEDVRARLAVLSEIAPQWLEHLRRWLVWSAPLRLEGMPADADLAMLFQTIVGAWPLDLDPGDATARGVFAERLAAWQQKALREAKLRSDWVDPNPAYEEAASSFVIRLIGERAVPDLLEDIAAFVARIAPAGAVNGLAQLMLKLMAPGVPDIYQGTEFWDFSLVDPDNRRPVDFATRASMPDDIPLDSWRDGRIKQRLLATALAVRARQASLFTEGAHEPLRFNGPHADNLVGFARRTDDDMAVVIVPRLPLALLSTPGRLSLKVDGEVELPSIGEGRLVCALSGREIEAATVSVAALMDRWPVVLLTSRR